MNWLRTITRWPWTVATGANGKPVDTRIYGNGREVFFGCVRGEPDNEWQANVALAQLAPDHALLLACLMLPGAVVQLLHGAGGTHAVCVYQVGSPRLHTYPVAVDGFGCPVVADDLRAVLEAVLGLDREAP